MRRPDESSIPVNYSTAWAGLVGYGNVQPGERVLIHAAAGGVGIAAIQIGKRYGAEVHGTASPAYQMFATGNVKPDPRVRVYDGSIYFSDLLEQYEHNWQDRFKAEMDEIIYVLEGSMTCGDVECPPGTRRNQCRRGHLRHEGSRGGALGERQRHGVECRRVTLLVGCVLRFQQ